MYTFIIIQHVFSGALINDVTLIQNDEFIKKIKNFRLGLMNGGDHSAWPWGHQWLQGLT